VSQVPPTTFPHHGTQLQHQRSCRMLRASSSSPTLRYGRLVRPVENYVHRGCVFMAVADVAVPGGGGSRIFVLRSPPNVQCHKRCSASSCEVSSVFFLLSTLRYGRLVRPEENYYVHRGCVFNNVIKTNDTPDTAQYSKTAPPLYKWREL